MHTNHTTQIQINSQKMKLILKFFTFFFLLSCYSTYSQVSVTATTATQGPTSYTTLKAAFDAVNAGTHKGVITIAISGNTTETAAAVLNASGSGSSSYTAINIYPTTTGLSISGNLATPLIDLNGADNVTIDGRVNAMGSTTDLSISNLSTSPTAGTSALRFLNDATTNTVKYCTISGASTSASNGILFFSSTTLTTGNDNNTIDHNNITNAGGNRPANAILSLGTSLKENNGIVFSNNNIFDFLNTTLASNGIFLSTNTSACSITDNSFYETTTFNSTASSDKCAINISSTGGGFDVIGNYIGGNTNSCGGTLTKTGNDNIFYGIYLSVSATIASSVQNNTIKNIDWTNSLSSSWYGINIISGAVNIGTVTGNTISGITTANSLSTYSTNFYGIFKTGTGATNISNNSIGSPMLANSILASSTSTSNAQYVFGINNSGTDAITISGNTIANLTNGTANTTTSSSGGCINGIKSTAGTNTITGNTVRNINIANLNTAVDATASAIGINFTSTVAATQTISQNTVYNIANTNSVFSGPVIGIYCSGPSFAGVANRNLIHSLYTVSNSSKIWGIYIVDGQMLFSNNIIRLGLDENGNSLTQSCEIAGFYLNSSSSTNFSKLQHNTIYIGGTNVVTTTTNYTYGVFKANNAPDTIFNNIIVNQRQSTSAVLRHYSVNYATIPGYSDNNIYWYQASHGQIDKTYANIQTFRAYQQSKYSDMQSIIANPGFVAPSLSASSMNLSIDPTFAGTPVEGAGQASLVTDDFSGSIRSSNTPVDIGAFSGNYIGLTSSNDGFSPYIKYTAIGTIAPQNTFVLNNFATITDQISGVNTTSGTSPRLYYKASTHTSAFGANNSSFNGWKWVEADNTTSPYQFTIDFTLLFGGVPNTGTIQYFTVAQDLASTPNVVSWPIAGSVLSNVATITTAPTTPSSFSILSPPVAAAATNFTSQSFSVNWVAVSGATGYLLDLSTASDFSSFVSGYNNLDVGNLTTYSATGLTLNTIYYYRLRAYNTSGNSVYSNTIQTKTVDAAPTVQATNIIVVNNACGGSSFKFTRGNGSKVAVFIRNISTGNPTLTNGSGMIYSVSFTGQNIYGNTSSTYNSWRCIYVGSGNRATVTDLTLNTTYRVAVVEFNGASGYESYLNDFTGTNITNFVATSGTPLTGTKTVMATGGDYATLTEAMINLNNCGIGTGGVTFELGDNSYPSEYFPIVVFQPSGTAVTNPIKIEPAANRTPVISGNASTGLLTLYGTDYITIDGKNTNGSSLTFENTNTSTTAHTVWMSNIASYITLTNLSVLGAVTHDGGAYSRDAVIALSATTNNETRNSNITITNSRIGQATGVNKPSTLVKSTFYTSGTDQVLIDNCEFFNWYSDIGRSEFLNANAAIQLGYYNGGSNNTNWTITNNSFYFNEEQVYTQGRVHAVSIWGTGSNFNISNNYFGGRQAQCGGAKMKVSGSPFLMGFLYVHGHQSYGGIGSAVLNTCSNNTMANIDFSTSNVNATSDYGDGSRFFFTGIHSGLWTIENNTIGSMSSNNNITISDVNSAEYKLFDVYNPNLSLVRVTNIKNNQVGGINIGSPNFQFHFLTGEITNSGAYSTLIDNVELNTFGSNLTNSIYANSVTNTSSYIIGIKTIMYNSGISQVYRNNVQNIFMNAGSTIGLTNYSGAVTFKENNVLNIETQNGAATGIYVSENTGIATRNFIQNIKGTTTVTGMQLTSFSATQTIDNNIVSIGQGVSNATIYGIYSYYGQNIYFNTIAINGQATSGSNNSHAFYRNLNWAGTSNVRNNIFSNFRNNNGATGKNYVAYIGVTTSLTLRDNNYYFNGSGGVLGYSPSADKTSLPLFTGSDINSLIASPTLVNATGTNVTDYKSSVILPGTAISGFTTDFEYNLRAATSPQMGAFNFAGTNLWTGTTNSLWNVATNWNPQLVPISTSIVQIPNTTNKPISTNSITLAGITIDTGATLSIQPTHSLKINGNITNNGQIIFKSDATGNGMFDTFTGTITGSGTVQTERFIPARRAFRFLSPSVTTTSTINQNWQENFGATAGLGTHITGSGGATNGFDATGTNNPSLFTFNNPSGVWEVVSNTNSNTLTAGTAYRLMVRGDRTINLSSNTPTPTTTILRATGSLKTGNFTPTLNQTADGYSFVGNPYQAPIDIKAVLSASSNMNPDVTYYWDPTLNTRGGFVTRDLSLNSNSVASNFNQYLQPGQAVFVKKSNTNLTASMTITETNKAVSNGSSGVFKINSATNDYGLLRVNLQSNINNQWQTIDGTLAVFNDNYSWEVTQEDATKMGNLDEEVSFIQNNTSLSIAKQNNPSLTDELAIKLNKANLANYQWQFELNNYTGETPYLLDTQSNTYTQIENNTIVPFSTDATITNRYKIVFQNNILNSSNFLDNHIVVYPNPGKLGSSFYIKGFNETPQVTLYTILGQIIPIQIINNGSSITVKPNESLTRGVYLVNIVQDNKNTQIKWIVE